MDVSPDDLIGPMAFRLTLIKVRDGDVIVAAIAAKDGQQTIFWSAAATFDAAGAAVIPFWDQKLTLTRDGKSVHATFTKDGDGRGWETLDGLY